MTTKTTRDKIWSHVLNESIRNGNDVDVDSVADEVDCSRKTARGVLKTMDRERWIRERSTKYGVKYVPELTVD